MTVFEGSVVARFHMIRLEFPNYTALHKTLGGFSLARGILHVAYARTHTVSKESLYSRPLYTFTIKRSKWVSNNQQWQAAVYLCEKLYSSPLLQHDERETQKTLSHVLYGQNEEIESENHRTSPPFLKVHSIFHIYC